MQIGASIRLPFFCIGSLCGIFHAKRASWKSLFCRVHALCRYYPSFRSEGDASPVEGLGAEGYYSPVHLCPAGNRTVKLLDARVRSVRPIRVLRRAAPGLSDLRSGQYVADDSGAVRVGIRDVLRLD